MRWIPLLIVGFLLVVVQQSLLGVASIYTFLGRTFPDLLAVLAVLIALRARDAVDVALACWVLGMMVDLTTASGPAGATVVGPMAISYVLAGAAVFRIREAFFREAIVMQMLFAGLFTLMAHFIWLTVQTLAGGGSWSPYVGSLGQMLLVAGYTALATGALVFVLGPATRWLLPGAASRSSRRRRGLK